MDKRQEIIEQFTKTIDLISESETKPLVVVKITQYYQGHGKSKRYGRFKMDKLEHRILTKKGGFYVFLLFSNNYLLDGKIVHANLFKFRNQISWKQIIKLPDSFKTLQDFGLNG